MNEDVRRIDSIAGAKTWGRRGQNKARLDKKYVKWILRLDRGTPNYILEKEMKIKGLKL